MSSLKNVRVHFFVEFLYKIFRFGVVLRTLCATCRHFDISKASIFILILLLYSNLYI